MMYVIALEKYITFIVFPLISFLLIDVPWYLEASHVKVKKKGSIHLQSGHGAAQIDGLYLIATYF